MLCLIGEQFFCIELKGLLSRDESYMTLHAQLSRPRPIAPPPPLSLSEYC